MELEVNSPGGAAVAVRRECKYIRWRARNGPARTQAIKGYEDVIHKYEKDGWRLLRICPAESAPVGSPKYVELIFERKVSH